ncbi:MAG: zinc ribbon domain-containing protein, partial [Clostridia bacterium]|nr:zinc ribbon domain-containing protein [Clostridia bacterium]
MFCENCGTKLSDTVRFCPECGAAQGQSAPQPVASQSSRQRQAPPTAAPLEGLIGFSPKINDPAFAAYKRKSVTWSFLFASILAVIAIIAFPIYGKQSGEMDWPQSLFYGMG